MFTGAVTADDEVIRGRVWDRSPRYAPPGNAKHEMSRPKEAPNAGHNLARLASRNSAFNSCAT
ncbi:hypothetical protein XI04_19140 [Bradyrhizobium sp. CCBAU 11430]|nr:hypothetical protein [Bradyrhizobium sp. CCBAU 21360]MDA9454150.1 hypothetical protein [Bradyrhizobium sp. CCBAU 21359]MDA9515160.1 hypothetical protein [Bradyrhizobium sp. CCBAU 11430]